MHGYPDMPPNGSDLHHMGEPYVDLPPPPPPPVASEAYSPAGFLDLDPRSNSPSLPPASGGPIPPTLSAETQAASAN